MSVDTYGGSGTNAQKNVHLTSRELDVLREYDRTHNAKVTGTALGISLARVNACLAAVRLKLGVDDSWAACDEAKRLGLIGTRAA